MPVIDYNPGLPLFSLHLPKTGGSSLRAVLAAWFGPRLRLHYQLQGEFPAPVPLEPGSCIHGHFSRTRQFGVWQRYPLASQFIAVVREPVARYASRYSYGKKRGHAAFVKYASLEAFLWQLCDSPLFSLQDHLPFDLVPGMVSVSMHRHFVHLGICEDLQGSVDALACRLGFARIEVPHLNRTSAAPSLDQRLRSRLEQALAGEFELYQLAREVYRNV